MPHSSRSLSSSKGLVVSMDARPPVSCRAYRGGVASCRLPTEQLLKAGRLEQGSDACHRLPMRLTLTLAALLLTPAGCRQSEEVPAKSEVSSATLVFAGQGRDRLCLKEGEERAGFIT